MKPESRMSLKAFIHLMEDDIKASSSPDTYEALLTDIYKSIATEQIFTSGNNDDQLRAEQWENTIRQTHIASAQQFISHSDEFFKNCSNCYTGMYDRDIFSIIWGPLLASAGCIIEGSTDIDILEFSLDSFLTLAHVASYFNMSNVLDNLVYFLSKFSTITTEYITEEGENDPIEFIVKLGEKPSAQMCLIGLCGIVRKLGSNLGKSWDEVIHGLCHMYFLGLFPIISYVNHQFDLISENEKIDYTISLMSRDTYNNRKGLLSRLFTWSNEEDKKEQNIQISPIDPTMWLEFQEMLHNVYDNSDDEGLEKEEEEEEEEEEKEEEEKEEEGPKEKKKEQKMLILPVSGRVMPTNSAVQEETEHSESTKDDEEYSDDESESSEEKDSEDDDLAYSVATNPYELTYNETVDIQRVLECIEKCRLDLMLPSSSEWSNNSLLIVVNGMIHLAATPYQLDQRKNNEEGKASIIACMYSRVFAIEFVTGIAKYNMKRLDIVLNDLLQLFHTTVEECNYLSFEIQTIVECSFELIFNCINNNQIESVHKLFSVLLAVILLPSDVVQALAPLIASGIAVLINEYGVTLSIIGCWGYVISLLQKCMEYPHAINRCYKCVFMMFSKELTSSIPPSALSLLNYILQTPNINVDVYEELTEDLLVINDNCWKMITKDKMRAKEKEETTTKEREKEYEAWLAVLDVICKECRKREKELQYYALQLLFTVMNKETILILSSEEYEHVLKVFILPTLKESLLHATGIYNTSSHGEKPRVTRIQSSITLSTIIAILFSVLSSHFESILPLESFSLYWIQSIQILHFIHTISTPDGDLEKDVVKALKDLLALADRFFLLRGEDKTLNTEFWSRTVTNLSGYSKDFLEKLINTVEKEEESIPVEKEEETGKTIPENMEIVKDTMNGESK